ncbi:hypothetical protein DMUE_2593 [Dictyocoela muelleri]|nr:hypothetical protein DMUE_2593 [Dictyocoela muelleri]
MFTLGTLRNNTVYTNKGTFESDYYSETSTPLVAKIINNKAVIFFEYFIFNSIVIDKDDDYYILKSDKRTLCSINKKANKKTNAGKKFDNKTNNHLDTHELEFNKIYTFIIYKETETERIVKIYKFNYNGAIYRFLNSYYNDSKSKTDIDDNDRIEILEYCFKNYKSGEIVDNQYYSKKKSKKNKNSPENIESYEFSRNSVFPGDIYLVHFNKNKLITPIGTGTIECTRIHNDKEKFFAMLYRVDENIFHFVDLSWYKPVNDNFIPDLNFGNININNKDLINLKSDSNVITKLNCIVNYENYKIFGLKNGNIMGILYKPMNYKIGDIVEVKICGLREGKVIFKDYYQKNNIYQQLEGFESDKLKDKSNINKEAYNNDELDLSVPFNFEVLKRCYKNEIKEIKKIKKKEYVQGNIDICNDNKVVNDKEEIKEVNDKEKNKEVNDKEENKKVNDKEENKKVNDNNYENNNYKNFNNEFNEITLTDLNIDEYLKSLFKKDKYDAFEWVKNNRKYIYKSIPIIYEYFDENPRVWVEKLLFNNSKNNSFKSNPGMRELEIFIEMEKKIGNKEHIRELFKRGVNMNWSVLETKEWFKKWIEWDCDKEGVKNMAIEYVKNLKKK